MVSSELAATLAPLQLDIDPPSLLRDPPQLETRPPLNIHSGEITKTQVCKALKILKNDKAAGLDNIPAESLKEGGDGMVNQLHKLLKLVWTTRQILIDWKKGLLVKLPKRLDTMWQVTRASPISPNQVKCSLDVLDKEIRDG